ncbi:hypothetical protein SLS62_003312 [Diatrype stigma]|uniref:Isochorismatase-like domain-containing protein n=1 Tax=Diatrype stigma TaxID=117547 RepID=A0AAN9UWT5_9PEZI
MKTALLIIDMQNYFHSMVKDAIPNITALHEFFAARSLPVFFTQHGHPASDLAGPPFRNQLVRKWGPEGSIRRGADNPDWRLIPAIQKLAVSDAASPTSTSASNRRSRKIIDKNTYDAFVDTDLAELLRGDAGANAVERLVVCGVMTDCCCETTARSAFNRGWETWLVADACGSASRAQHERSLKSYDFGYGPTRSTAEVIAMLEKEG